MNESVIAPRYLHQRKKEALWFIAGHGQVSAARALAVLETGHGMPQTASTYIAQSLDAVRRREDCRDLHLALLLYLYQKYRHHLADADAGQIRDAVLELCTLREVPPNIIKGSLDDNDLLNHALQYLAGCLFEHLSTVAQQREVGKALLLDWFDRFLRFGYAQGSSAAHIPAAFMGLFALYLMAPDESVRQFAKQALDLQFRMIGYSQFYGVMPFKCGLACEETQICAEQAEMGFLFWIAAGSGRMAAGTYAAVLFALSAYEPPAWEKDVQVGRRQYAAVEWDKWFYPAKTYSYRTGSFLLSCIRRFKPTSQGYKPYLMHAFMGTRAAPFCFNHPGEGHPFENRCPPCPAGNGTMVLIEQYRALQMMAFRLDAKELVHGIRACAPVSLYDEISVDGEWFFARVEDAYLAVRFSSPFQLNPSGFGAEWELTSAGLDHAVIVRMGSEAEFISFQHFMQCMRKAAFSWDGQDGITFHDPEYGHLCMCLTGETTINGQALPYLDAAEPNIQIGFIGRAQPSAAPEKEGEAELLKQKMILFMDSGDTMIDEGTEAKDASGIVYHAELFPGAGQALRALYDQGHTIALVADGETQSFDNIYNENGLFDCFRVRVISEEVGEQKPARSMFQTALEALDLCDEDKHRIVMVGNNIFKDVTGANRFGIHSILINRSSRYIMAPATIEQTADFVIREPLELPGIIAWMEDYLL